MAGPLEPDEASPLDPPTEPAAVPAAQPDADDVPATAPATSAAPFDLWHMRDPLEDFTSDALEDFTHEPPVTPLAAQPAPPAAAEPVSGGERVDLIDSMRGLAVLGILLMNMSWFAWPPARHFGSYVVAYGSQLDKVTDLVFRFFCEGKFYIIFSFLFGLGMLVQKDRVEARGRNFYAFFARRMFWLIAIGVIHGYFIWSGDILVIYAISGMVLLLVRGAWALFNLALFGREFKRLGSGISLVGAALLLYIIAASAYNWFAVAAQFPEPWSALVAENLQSQQRYLADLAVYQHGSYAATLNLRMAETHLAWSNFAFLGMLVMASFLVGAFAWRAQWISQPQRHRTALRLFLMIALPLGLVSNAVYIATEQLHVPQSANWLGFFSHLIGQYTLGYAYLAGLTLLYLSGRAVGMFRVLAPVGRMALTNYITHSVVFTLIFNGYGLGLMGQIGEATAYLMAITVYALQVMASTWWLKRFHFGPLEWLWRSLTYLKPQPMRRPKTYEPWEIL